MRDHYDAATIAEYLAGELDVHQTAVVEEHLAECGRCQAEADMAREFLAVDAGRDLGQRSSRLRAQFDARLAAHDAPRRASKAPRASRRWAVAVAAAAVIVAAIGVQQTFRGSTPPTPTGELLSVPPSSPRSLSIDSNEGSWSVHLGGVSPDEATTLRVEDSAGHPVLESTGSSGQWSFRVDDFTEFDDNEVYFVRVFGRDTEGRRWIEGPLLLPRQ